MNLWASQRRLNRIKKVSNIMLVSEVGNAPDYIFDVYEGYGQYSGWLTYPHSDGNFCVLLFCDGHSEAWPKPLPKKQPQSWDPANQPPWGE
jgi:prepilin-type processing-associated H-X9-DG protein